MARRLGLEFNENMYGTYSSVGEPELERRFAFHVDAVSRDLVRTLRDGRVEATGWVEAEGLAAHAAIHGFLIVKPLAARLIHYEFEFLGDDGSAYRFVGSKTIRHLHPMRTWTVLPGVLRDGRGTEIARSVTRFDVGELRAFLRSFRPTLRSRAGVAPADAG
jgi:hypothetical protein